MHYPGNNVPMDSKAMPSPIWKTKVNLPNSTKTAPWRSELHSDEILCLYKGAEIIRSSNPSEFTSDERTTLKGYQPDIKSMPTLQILTSVLTFLDERKAA